MRPGFRVGPHFGGPLPAGRTGRSLGALGRAKNLRGLSGP